MARIHSHRKGKSHATRLASRMSPSWVTQSPDEVTSLIVNFAKEGHKPSQIGIKLRDEYGIPLTRPLVGKSVSKVLSENNLLDKTPDDLNRLLVRAGKLQSHLSANPADRKNVRSLELLEAKIHRLSRYYKRIGKVPSTWKYAAAVAQLE